jgi:histidyl-tRNA synthetase
VRALWRELGLLEGQHVRLEINSLGQPEERRAHREALVAWFGQHADVLDADSQRRLHSNPLRILDSKNPAMQPLIEGAPKLLDFLGEASLAHFDAVRATLDAVGLAYRVNPRLVRGMDYYNLTVFEWITEQLGSQGTVCGGGRYDGLIEQLGGKPAPAVGFGLGIERLLLLLQELRLPVPDAAPDAYAVVPAGVPLPKVVATLEALRASGLRVLQHAAGRDGPGSLKSQFKKADASGARFALIFGPDELAQGKVAVKALRDGSGAQQMQPLDDAASWAPSLR